MFRTKLFWLPSLLHLELFSAPASKLKLRQLPLIPKRQSRTFFASLCNRFHLETFVFKLRGYQMAKKSKRRAWTTEHVRTLKTLAKKKSPAGRIAKTLKRTEGATRQKAFSMGLSLDSRT
jgi:hypothetical protein